MILRKAFEVFVSFPILKTSDFKHIVLIMNSTSGADVGISALP